MSCLIFCSFEVGGLPYYIAKILNKRGIMAYYVSIARSKGGHDSTQFHFGKAREPWDLSNMFSRVLLEKTYINLLAQIKEKNNISSCFATGGKSYLLKKAGIKYKYWCYGSDLDQNCFSPTWHTNYPFWEKGLICAHFFMKVRHKARQSICNADELMISPYQLNNLNLIYQDKALFFLPHLLPVKDYEKLLKEKEESKKKICEELNAEHFFFSSTRHFWQGKKAQMSDNKGNDIILKSFANYLKISRNNSVKLVLIKKGPDVEASKSLIRDLGIEKQTVWLDEMKRDSLEKYYKGATVCYGQFGTPVLTYASLEPLSHGTICISFFDAVTSNVPYYKELPPVINSKEPIEIAHILDEIVGNNDYKEKLSTDSFSWVKYNCSENAFVKAFLNNFSSGQD